MCFGLSIFIGVTVVARGVLDCSVFLQGSASGFDGFVLVCWIVKCVSFWGIALGMMVSVWVSVANMGVTGLSFFPGLNCFVVFVCLIGKNLLLWIWVFLAPEFWVAVLCGRLLSLGLALYAFVCVVFRGLNNLFRGLLMACVLFFLFLSLPLWTIRSFNLHKASWRNTNKY